MAPLAGARQGMILAHMDPAKVGGARMVHFAERSDGAVQPLAGTRRHDHDLPTTPRAAQRGTVVCFTSFSSG